MENNKADAVRIQTSVLNALEKKVLVWLAERQPRWMTSDILTYIGTFGAVVIAAGYILSAWNINFLWLSSLGFVINWYGDSLDGTLARVRNTQRPVYGYYLDHTIDAINVSINAHLKKEFKLTYASMGPTEFRIIMIIINTLFALIRPLREFSHSFMLCGHSFTLGALDYIGILIIVILALMHLTTVRKDIKDYAKMDPMPKRD